MPAWRRAGQRHNVFMALHVILLSSSEETCAVDAVFEQAKRSLEAAGVPLQRGGVCSELVHLAAQAGAVAPDQVVVAAPAAELTLALRALGGEPPWPVTLLASGLSDVERDELLGLGLAGWWPVP